MAEIPHRIQLSRRRGWRMPPNTVKVDRTTGYGNPYVIGEYPGGHLASAVGHGPWPIENADQAVTYFRKLLVMNAAKSDGTVDELLKLRGKNLACWCAPDAPCHADVLLEFANMAPDAGSAALVKP